MTGSQVTVFGGTGFLGRRIVERLLERDLKVRVAVRSAAAAGLPEGTARRVELAQADIRDPAAVQAAVAGARAAINAVGLYVEQGSATFRAVHVEGAKHLAEACRQQGVKRLLHFSGIGADPASRSPYVSSRGAGEAAVRRAFEEAVIFRPSAMFGADDAFLNALQVIIRRSPVIPLFGRGETRLQPVCVDDVAEAAARVLTGPQPPQPLYELGGPEILTYRELLRLLMRHLGRRPLLMPLPFALWDAAAAVAGLLPAPPLTEGQVALMKQDNLAAPDLPGLAELGISATPISAVLQASAGLREP